MRTLSKPRRAALLARMAGTLVFALGIGSLAVAQSSGGSYVLRKSVIGASVWAQGSPYRVEATAGQASAGVASAASYRVTAGFHRPNRAGGIDRIFCNGFDTSSCTLGVMP